jgi:hemolysin activation/secretion protein
MASQYEYAKITVERNTILPLGFQSVSRIQGQISTTNLEGSEQLLFGARGYSANIEGDQGYIINQEFRTPVWRNNLPFLKNKKSLFLSTQVLGFLDYGQDYYKHLIPSDITLTPQLGTGIGLRNSITGHFSLSADLGWRLRKDINNPYDPPSRGSFSASIAY